MPEGDFNIWRPLLHAGAHTELWKARWLRKKPNTRQDLLIETLPSRDVKCIRTLSACWNTNVQCYDFSPSTIVPISNMTDKCRQKHPDLEVISYFWPSQFWWAGRSQDLEVNAHCCDWVTVLHIKIIFTVRAITRLGVFWKLSIFAYSEDKHKEFGN